jgi:hypothetical protein
MDVPLLFQRKPKTTRSKELVRIPLCEQDYYDIEYIRNAIIESVTFPDNWEPPLRVRLVRDVPVKAFRASIFFRWKEKRSVKNKDGSTSLISPGLYIWRQFFVEKVSPTEYVFTPPLTQEV